MKRHREEGPDGMGNFTFFQLLLWWFSRIALALCACFFVFFGIVVLIASFHLGDPFLFIMSFLSSTLIILISAAILAGIIARTIKALHAGKDRESETGG